MEEFEGIEAFYPPNAAAWRSWLETNGASKKSVYLICYHKKSGIPTISYEEAIEQALCFGWIDSKAKGRDAQSSYLKFTPRNPKSSWSRRNRERVASIAAKGWIHEQGQRMIDLAKQTGRWGEEG